MADKYTARHEGSYQPRHTTEKRRRGGQNFITGAAILGVAGLLVKVISACFKIPLTNLIGVSGMGYFNAAYTVYNMLANISSVGLSVAVAKCISEYVALGKYRDVKSVTRVAYTTFVFIGLICSVAFFVFADSIAAWLENPQAALACRAMSPAILVVSLISVYKGYAQGYSDMVPSAVSNIIEALTKLVCGLGGAYLLQRLGYGLPIVVAGAVIGVTMGSVFSLIYLMIRQRLAKRTWSRLYPITLETPPASSYKSVLKKFVWVAVPITIGSLTTNVASTIDLALVMRRLITLPGVDGELANSMYGAYSSMALTVFNMPATILVSIGVSVLPAVSAAFALKNFKRLDATINSSVKLCTVLSMPFAFGMSALAGPVLSLLFRDEWGVGVAAPLLATLGPAFFFMSCAMLCAPLLQAVGRAGVPVVNILIASVVKIISNYILVGRAEIGIWGAAISNVVMYALLFVLDFIALRKITGTKADVLNVYIKPLIAGALCGATAWGVYTLAERFIYHKIATILAILAAGIVYLLTILYTRTIKREDVEFLPKAKKIEKILEKRNWIG